MTRPVREYLDALDAAEEPRTIPKNVSLTDPAAQWTAAPGGPAFYACSTNYLIDTQAGIIVDVEATPAYRTDEVNAIRIMVDRVEERFEIKPGHLIGDTAYGTAEMLGWMVNEKGIEPHVPAWDKSEWTDGSFSRSDFIWDADADEYRCPEGNALRSRQRNFKKLRTTATKAGTVIYRPKSSDCGNCPMKSKCCPNTSFRKIARQLNEETRDLARQLADTERYARSRRLRKKVEMLFAHLKRIMKLDRLRLRGLQGARYEFLLAATTQNLRRMAMWLTPKDQKRVMARLV